MTSHKLAKELRDLGAVDLTRRLVKIGTSKTTEDALDLLEAFFQWNGIETHRRSGKDRGEVLRVGQRRRSHTPSIMLATHIDTVPQSQAPRERPGTVRDGRILGRGALDMKSGVAISMLLMKDFFQSKHFDLTLVVTSDEEADSAGAWSLVGDGSFRHDLVLVPEPTWERVALSASGRRCWDVSFASSGGHSEGALGTRGDTISALSSFISRLPKGFTPLSLESHGGGEVTLPTLSMSRVDHVFREKGAGRTGEEIMEKLLKETLKAFPGVKGERKLITRETPWPEPYSTSKSQPLVRAFLVATSTTLGKAHLTHESAVGDFNAYGCRSPTIIFGPSGDGAHGTDEYVEVRSIFRCLRTYNRFLGLLERVEGQQRFDSSR